MKRASMLFGLLFAGCFSPPDEPMVEGPTLTIEISASEADIVEGELMAAALLDGAAQTQHAAFLAEQSDSIAQPERLVAVGAARVRVAPTSGGVDELADAFDGLMAFVAAEEDPGGRTFVASGVAPASAGPFALTLIGTRQDYEDAQPALRSPRFWVGVSGPTPIGMDRTVALALRVELSLTVVALESSEGGHGL